MDDSTISDDYDFKMMNLYYITNFHIIFDDISKYFEYLSNHLKKKFFVWIIHDPIIRYDIKILWDDLGHA